MSNQTKECSIGELQSKLQKTVKQFLDGDEKVLLCLQTIYSLGLGLFGSVRSAHVITERKLIKVDLSEYSHNESMQLADIQSVQESSDGLGTYRTSALGHGGVAVHCDFRSRQASEKFARTLREAIEHVNTLRHSIPTQHPADVEERFRLLTKLHKDNLVSEDEFQKKRKEILGEL
jgi:hypothetical protein